MVGGEVGKCVSMFLVVKRVVGEYVPSCRARRARQSSPLERMRAFRQTASSNMGRNRTPTLADFVAANYTRDAIALAPTPRDVRPKCNPHPLRKEEQKIQHGGPKVRRPRRTGIPGRIRPSKASTHAFARASSREFLGVRP